MKIRVVSKRPEIATLNANERIVHLAFRPSNKDIFMLLETCPKLQVIQIPHSYFVTIAKSVVMLLDSQRVQLIEGDVWGQRTDLNEYYEVPSYVTDSIFTLKEETKPNGEKKTTDDIVEEISRKHRLNQGFVRILLNDTCC